MDLTSDHIGPPIWKFVDSLYILSACCLTQLLKDFPPYDAPFWPNLRLLLASIKKSFHKTTRLMTNFPATPNSIEKDETYFLIHSFKHFFFAMMDCETFVKKMPTKISASSGAAEGLWCGNAGCDNMCGPSEMRLKTFACGGRCGVRYCSRACQEADWRARHKAECRPA